VHIGGGKLEQFAPGAFAEMLARPTKIDLRWGSHDDHAPRLANTIGGGLEFFADDYGLGFSATLSLKGATNYYRLSAMVQRKNPTSFCSIGGLMIKASRQEKVLIGTAEVVTSATIDHVTICNGAAYHRTAVWPAHLPLDDAPWRIQELAARWAEGHAAWKRNSAARRRPRAVQSSIEARLEGMRAEIMRLRGAFAANPEFSGIIMGHIAFSKAADRIFGGLRK